MAVVNIIKPQAGFQNSFVRSNVDFVVGGGALGSGKSFAAVLSVAEPSYDPNFRGLFLRNNLGDLRSGGGLLDNFREAYGSFVEVTESGEPRVIFPSGAKIDVTHVSDQSREKVLQRFKGRQYDFVYFDEGTGFTWECFTAIMSRNRGKAKWTGKIRMTTNPDADHWLRTFIDWYIGSDGFIREDRNGIIRYFFMAGETVKDVIWGDTKEEVYDQCKIQIDRVIAKINGKEKKALLTYKDVIKSFTFYLGKMSENVEMMKNNEGYAGSVAVMGGRSSQQLLEGNWNVSLKGDVNTPITYDDISKIFDNDPKITNEKWITCDLADTGTDNFIAIAWNGFHVEDIVIVGKSTPRENANNLIAFANKHHIPDNHIIYDAIRGIYINDYIPEAVPFVSYKPPIGQQARMASRLKDECYLRLIDMIKSRDISISEEVLKRRYTHQKIKESISIQNELLEEVLVVKFRETPTGKKTLFTKKEMNAKLGKSRSMDLLDPFAMRMFPILKTEVGTEISKASADVEENDVMSFGMGFVDDVFDDTFWC